MRKKRKHLARGQALVEFAMVGMLLILLLGAAIDGGLMFLTYQNLISSAEEGLNYGTLRPVYITSGANPQTSNNDAEIFFRARHEGGIAADRTQANLSFVSLFDLDNDGVLYPGDSSDEPTRIAIAAYTDENKTSLCAARVRGCWLNLTIRYKYKMRFMVLPVLGKEVELQVSRWQQITHY